MGDDGEDHDAFATDGLWKPSSFFEDPATHKTSLFAPIQLDVPQIKLHHPYAPTKPLEQELRLPDIESFEFGPLPELDGFDESSVSIDTPPPPHEDDVWEVALELGPANKHITFFTWEWFENSEHVETNTPYITESGPAAFDAALVSDDSKTTAGRVIKDRVLLESLWNLGLGRSSILFSFNAKLRSFESAIADGRASGVSPRTAQSVTNQFIHTGNTFLHLRSFVERTFAAADSIPARVALATAVSSLLSTFEEHLGRQSNNIRSVLQLQRLFAKPREILTHVAKTVDNVKHARSNEQLSSLIHHRLLEAEEGDTYIRKLSCQILRQVAQPSIDLLSEWVGIRQEQETVPFADRGGFVAVNDNPEQQGPTEYIYRSELMPRFVSPEDGNTVFETGNALRFLKYHHPEHPLASLHKFDVQSPQLEWKFDWDDIETISTKAKAYEEELRKAILEFSNGTSTQKHKIIGAKDSCCLQPTDHEEYLQDSMRFLDGPPKQLSSELPDELKVLTEQVLRGREGSHSAGTDTFSPPLSITSTLSFGPLLSAQAKLVNATTVRLFFRSHKLRLHLALQRQYQLFGDGVFSSGLASALFDPERESAERHKGQMRSGVHMGLQLGARESWPPASSELRLALMGLLSENYYSSALYHSTQDANVMPATGRDKNELPGQLNFAVRQLDESAMERIMDPYGLYALDFLRLQYVPPSPLNLVITSVALEKYDYIFRFLLRLLRMIFVVAHLPRQYPDVDSRCFRTEAHHFVTALSTYIFQTGIAEHWDGFQSYVTTLEHRLADEDAANELGVRVTEGLAAIRDAHEKCLDSILFSLLLRRRQRKVMALIEEIFELILLFAKKQNADTKVEDSIKDMYLKLRGKIKVFLNVCRQLTGKKGYGKGKGTAEEDTMERLGVLLEMNTYFS
ncbi:uncharacterized protein CC84DRAFT_1119689 [Paraphaeosphaeria sporulosa]|uniref:Spindle pole body component n=1 Tax=Paraphaeosphaeria sporulosa TaxID=1460663 RepID=A0A177CGS7_9PLEO|nr:uncharacterized protein CC84DRAFT_1119689 [Paraphaeosphaeria sporulosa]OAG06049.1 hypothetical protein CC84DRAFT_1119689 [Paraphaeosphaeria sporulosa]